MGRCQYQHCETHAVFNLEGSKSAAFCKQHSTSGMVDVVHKLCLNDACTKQPSFGVAGSKTSMYCKQHAKEGMVNVFNKRCLHESCVKFPTFNVRSSKTAGYCKQHAHDDMVDVYTKRCLHDYCMKRPSYNVRGSKTAVYYKLHSQDGMVGVLHKRCLHDSCTKRPTSNVKGSMAAMYCKSHAWDGMVNFHKMSSLEGFRTTAPQLMKSAATTPTRHTSVDLDGATNNSNPPAAVVDRRKRSRVDLDEVQHPLCSNHFPLHIREACRNTRVDSRKGDICTPSSSSLPRLLHDDTVRTVNPQSNHCLASRMTILPDENQSRLSIKTEMGVAVLF